MKLLALEIEGYGVWSGLKLQRMSEGLNVVYGPNEAGKSTLLHFIRSALYGFSPDRRRYLPPLHGGRPGGWLEVSGAGGQFQIARYPSPDGNPRLDETLITAADGTGHSEQVVKTLLANIDEATFNNVFAVSLSEMQELATLSDTQAADVLYSITAGLDRVSLVEVTRDLETTRNQILDQHGGPSQITQLMHQREQIRRQIEEQQSHAQAYARLAGDRGVLERELSRLEEEKEELRQQLDLRDLAAAVRDRWHRHRALGEELSSLGPQITVPADAVERLEAIKQRASKASGGHGAIAAASPGPPPRGRGIERQRGPGPARGPHHGHAWSRSLGSAGWKARLRNWKSSDRTCTPRCSPSTRRWASANRPSPTACRIFRRRPSRGFALRAAICASA